MTKKRFNLVADDKLIAEFSQITKQVVLTPTGAIRLFMPQTVNHRKIPFRPKFNNLDVKQDE